MEAGSTVEIETDSRAAIRFNKHSLTNRITKGKDSMAVGSRLGVVFSGLLVAATERRSKTSRFLS